MILFGILKSTLVASTSPWRLLARNYKVTVVGAGGGIGQPLSLLIRQNAGIRELALHDINEIKGIATDLSHISMPGRVTSFVGESELEAAVSGANVVVVAAGKPRLPGMEREQLMAANGVVAAKVASAVSVACPGTLLAFITNPINMIVPTAAEILKANGVFDPRRLFGITTLDVVRAKKFIGTAMGKDPRHVDITVIGGHAGTTILPLISTCKPKYVDEDKQIEKMVHRIQEAGTEVVEAKAGSGSATLSMAFAGAQFVDALLRGIRGHEGVVECAFVASELTEAPFFASNVELGQYGVKRYLDMPQLSEMEMEALAKLLPILRKSAEEGIEFARKYLKELEETVPTALPKAQ
ncbi:uncharacterized protein [Drosophila bipectinata]|uniref:uncharacterized protein n=1 Tax=Drosophila bipectinata TaxID=42026 RepID=UPI001C89EFCF|nr:malate dehydrogenase, mitochondrial [Drosophila bipectinata]